MNRPLLLFALLALLVLLAVAAYLGSQRVFVSEEMRIARQLDGLAESFEKDKEETLLVALQRSKKVLAYFADEFIAEPGPPFPQVDNAQQFAGLIATFRKNTRRLRITKLQRDIRTIGTKADVVTTLRASYEGLGDRGTEIRSFQIGLEKISGTWLITRVDLLEPGT